MPVGAPLLACRSVSRTIERAGLAPFTLLNDISFFVERAATLVVLRPSGAGKSNLLRLLNHLDEPSAGQILLNSLCSMIFISCSITSITASHFLPRNIFNTRQQLLIRDTLDAQG